MTYDSGTGSNQKRVLRLPHSHYITGLGDGNRIKSPPLPPKNDDDDDYEDYVQANLRFGGQHEATSHRTFSRSRRQRPKDSYGGGSVWFGSGKDNYNSVEVAPWQLPAFALLGAVVLLSALFLHVLADTAAETSNRRRARHRRTNSSKTSHNNNPKKTKLKEKIEDHDDYHHGEAVDSNWIAAGTSYDYDEYSETTRRSDHSQPQTQSSSTQQPPSLYYPYPSTLLRRTAAGAGSSNTSYQHRVYNLNPGATLIQPSNSNSNVVVASKSPTPSRPVASPAPTSASKPKVASSPIKSATAATFKPLHQRGAFDAMSPPPPAYKAPTRPPAIQQPMAKVLSDASSFESLYDMSNDTANNNNNNPNSSRHSSASAASRTPKPSQQPLQPNLSPLPSTGHLEPALLWQESASNLSVSLAAEDVTESSYGDLRVEETPRRFNGRKTTAVCAPNLPQHSNSASNNLPLLPALQPKEKGDEFYGQNRNSNSPPRPVLLDDLHLMMESGNVPPHWHVVVPPSPSAAPTNTNKVETIEGMPSLPFADDQPILINQNDISSHGSYADNDPRRNIDHVRGDLTQSTDSAASLQGAIDFSELQLIEVIGGGGFGQVWRATWRSTPVAVKVLTGSAQSRKVPRNVLEEFAAEINLLRGMRHPNICLYMGASLKPPNRAIITELAANGSLWDALRLALNPPYRVVGRPHGLTDEEAWPPVLYQADARHGRPPSTPGGHLQSSNAGPIFAVTPSIPAGSWPWALVKRVASGTARGMAYLHSGNPPVLHRDLKSANILLDESYTPKVCDFGLSRLQSSAGTSMTGNCGTVQWMAPEVLANQRYNEKADVFSYGIILWELLTRTCPYEGMGAVQCALAVLNRNHRPSIPQWCPPFMQVLIRACLKTDPQERPTFFEILNVLQSEEEN